MSRPRFLALVALVGAVALRCSGGLDPNPYNSRGASAGRENAGTSMTTANLSNADAGVFGWLPRVAPAHADDTPTGAMKLTLQLYSGAALEVPVQVVDGDFAGARSGAWVCSGQVDRRGSRGKCVDEGGEIVVFETRTTAQPLEAAAFCVSDLAVSQTVWHVVIVERTVIAGLWSREGGQEVLTSALDKDRFTLTSSSGRRYDGLVRGNAVVLQSAGSVVQADSSSCPALLPKVTAARAPKVELDVVPAAITGVLGSMPSSLRLTLVNSGGEPTGPLVASIGGLDRTQFALQPTDCVGAALAPADRCEVSVLFTPTSPGVKSAELVITANPGGTARAPLQATATTPLLVSNATTVNFGATALIGAPSVQPLVLTNRGDAPTGAITATTVAPFVADASGCPALEANAQCTINIGFKPIEAGSFQRLLTITMANGSPLVVTLTGTGGSGLPAAPGLTAVPASVSFGEVALPSMGVRRPITLINTGTAATGALTFVAAPPFFVDSRNCAVLAPGQTCDIEVGYVPTVLGASQGQLNVTSASGVNLIVPLLGRGVAGARLVATPTAVAFGNLALNSSQTAKVSVTNLGGQPTTINLRSVITGPHLTEFIIADGGCSGVLPPMGTCDIYLRFTPTAVGLRSAILTVADGAVSVAVPLSGTGKTLIMPRAGAFRPTPSAPPGAVPPAPARLSFTIENTTPAAAVPVIRFEGDVAAFRVSQGPCATVLPAGATCNLEILFAPARGGTHDARLIVAFGNTSDSVPLSGLGIGVAISPANPTVRSGLSIALTAIEFAADGSVTNLTNMLEWATGNVAVATVTNAQGARGTVTGVGQGTALITTFGFGKNASTLVTVLP